MSIDQVMETISNSLTSQSENLRKDEPSPVDDERYILGDNNRRCFSPTPTSTSSCSVSTCVNSPTLRASVVRFMNLSNYRIAYLNIFIYL